MTDDTKTKDILPSPWLTVESLDLEAQGVAHRPDGKVVFIEGALPFEQVTVNVGRKKNNWEQNGIEARLDEQRGFDHGLFVPLKLMFPEATIPSVQLSLLDNLDPAAHIEIGKALHPLRQENVLFIGSGFSFHNMRAFFTGDHGLDKQNAAFEEWLVDICTNPAYGFTERSARLVAWDQAPAARHCHPREEHLLPLHVCAGLSDVAAELLFDGEVLGKKTCGFIWHY